MKFLEKFDTHYYINRIITQDDYEWFYCDNQEEVIKQAAFKTSL